MNNILFFKDSDGWLFSTLLCLGQRNVSLKNIILTGDTLNHAIFSLEEINGGLSRLESENYIEFKKSYLYFKEKAKRFNKLNRRLFEGGIVMQVRYSNLFKEIPLENEVKYKQYFSIEDYDAVIKNIN